MKNLNILLILAFGLLFSCKSFSQVIETDEDFTNNSSNNVSTIYQIKNYNNKITSNLLIELSKIKSSNVQIIMKGEKVFDEFKKSHLNLDMYNGLIAFNLDLVDELMNFEQLMKHFGVDKKYWNFTFYHNCEKMIYPKNMIGKLDFIQKVYINHKIKSIKLKTLDTSCDPKPPGTIMIR